MTKYATGNAIGSTDPRDLYDNAQNIDEWANSESKSAHPDRLGVSRRTFHGMESEYDAFMSSFGYAYLGDYAAGINVTASNQLVKYDGEYWKPAASAALPFTTSGTWVGGDDAKFVAVGDAALRSEIGSGVRRVSDIASLRGISGRFAGDSASVLGYYTPGDGGGGPVRVWKTGPAGTYVDNGGSIIVPTGGDGSGAWVWGDVAQVDALWFGVDATGQSVTNNTLTRYLDYMASSKAVGTCSGNFLVDAPFNINMVSGTYIWDGNFTTNNVSEVGLYITAGTVEMYGNITVNCADTLSDTSEAHYYARRQDIGMYVTAVRRCRLARLNAFGTKRTGVLVTSVGGNSNMFHIDTCYTYYNGTKGIFSDVTSTITNTGGLDSAAQRCVVTVPNAIPSTLEYQDYVTINGQLHIVMSVDFATKTLTLYPRARDTTTGGAIAYYIGEGVRVVGSDANVGHIRLIDATRVGTGAKLESLYGCVVDVFHSSIRGVGVAIGRIGTGSGNISRGGYIGWLYNEENTFDIVEVGLSVQSWSVITNGDTIGIDHVLLQPIAGGFRRKINTQKFSENDVPEFRALTLTSQPDRIGGSVSQISMEGLTDAANLTALIEKVNEPSSFGAWGTFRGVRGSAGSSVGRNNQEYHFRLTAYSVNTLEPYIYIEHTGAAGSASGFDFRRVSYEGEEWWAVSLGGSNDGSRNLSVIGSHSFTYVASSDVTFIESKKANQRKVFGEHVELAATGIFRPVASSDNTLSLGSAANRWSEVFAGNATINTSDSREKQQVRNLSESERLVALDIKQAMKAFKFNHAVARKGDDARTHVGVLAQDVAAIFEAHGLNPSNYALFCHDVWEPVYENVIEIDEVLDDDGNIIDTVERDTGEQRLISEGGDRYGIRYEQLLAFIISAL